MPGVLKAYIDSIRKEHHTDKYHSDGLIVRRGFPVKFKTTETNITLDMVPVHEGNRSELGPKFTISPGKGQDGWEVVKEGGDVVLKIPPNAMVGAYAIQIGSEKGVLTVLFNPFCKQDDCYMENENDRNEYVLNDVGRIWVGSVKSLSGRPWAFAQFKTKSLLASIDLLDRMPWEDRKNIVKVTRHLSAVINSSDDNGVLTGNWSGDYSGGTSPLAWTGSAEILAKFWDTQKSVEFGQCWVFSGVFTSVMRALGIPARSSTNFVSAHDSTKPYNRAVDKYYTVDGEVIEEKSYDSIWNFHVWNECWMKRQDLKDAAKKNKCDFSGWQAVDATPQEASHGLYQMGPAPLSAIKNGIVVPYDVDFVIGEVNADVCHHWQTAPNSDKFTLRSKHQRHVGQKVSTKAVGKDDRADVTLDYKYAEGSAEERAALARRPGSDKPPQPAVPEHKEDITFETEAPDDVRTGETLVVHIKATNKSKQERTILMNALARAVDYTGNSVGKVDAKKESFQVPAGASATLTLEVTPEEYKQFLVHGMPSMQIMCTGKVKESEQAWTCEEVIRFNSDDVLDIVSPPSVKLGATLEVQAVIKNIMAFPITGVQLRIEGQGLAKLTVVDLKDLQPNCTANVNMQIKPVEVGDKLLIITLDTKELKDLVRSVHIDVEDSEEGRESVAAVRERFTGRLEELLGNLGFTG